MRRKWLFAPIGGAISGFICFLPFLYLKDFEFESLFYLLALLAITLGFGAALLLRLLIYRRWVNGAFVVMALSFWVVSIGMFLSVDDLRPSARWLVTSESLRQRVLREPLDPVTGLQHIEWDGWGWAGMDTTVYLVYDPSDTLIDEIRRNPKGRFAAIAERTAKSQRLGRNWYSLRFYTGDEW